VSEDIWRSDRERTEGFPGVAIEYSVNSGISRYSYGD